MEVCRVMDEKWMNEHEKDYGMQDMDSMSRSNVWKDYGCMWDNVWIMCKGYGRCIWMDGSKVEVKIKDGKG